ncbi:MAG: hypothetical protein ACKOW3_08635 [Hyphomicrobium sp.]
MPINFARIYSVLMTVDDKFGLTPLEKDERAIFNYIVSQIANDKAPNIPQIVDANLTSRASTYRHLNNLEQAGLINLGGGDRRAPIALSSRFKGYDKAIMKLIKQLNIP